MMTQVFTGPPTITNPLTDQVIKSNTRVTLNCKASGGGTIEYQWQKYSNGLWMSISTNNTAEYQTDELTKSSQFRCVVSNEAGEVTSETMILILGKHIAYINVDVFTIKLKTLRYTYIATINITVVVYIQWCPQGTM